MPARFIAGKPQPGFTVLALRPACLVDRGVGHGDTRAIDELDVAAVPECAVRDVILHAFDPVRVDFVQHIERDFGAGLTVGAGVGTQGGVFIAREFSAHQGHDLANRFAAGAAIAFGPDRKSSRKRHPARRCAGDCYRRRMSGRARPAGCRHPMACEVGKGTRTPRTWKMLARGPKPEVFQRAGVRSTGRKEWTCS